MQPSTNLLDGAAVEEGGNKFVETTLEDGLVPFGQQEYALARHDLNAELRLELGPAEHAARVLIREKDEAVKG